jgi:hypothetical protein
VLINLYTTADTGMARPGTYPGRIRKGEYPHNILGIVFVNEKTVYVSEYHFMNSVFQIFILIALCPALSRENRRVCKKEADKKIPAAWVEAAGINCKEKYRTTSGIP